MARIDVRGPDGKEYTLDVAEWSRAKEQGFTLAKPTSQAESAARGAAQGLTLGWGDELAGHAKALSQAPADWLFEKLNPQEAGRSQTYGETYQEGRDAERSRNAAARVSNPLTYGASEFGGTLPLVALAPASLPAAVASGALMGAGGSEAENAGQLALDTGIGAGFGLGGYGAGKALSGAASRLSSKASGVAQAARSKAAEVATKTETAPVKALEGAYGGLRQTENKAILALLGLEEKGLIDTANAAKLAAFRASGRLAQALNEAAANDLEFLGSRVGQVATKKAESQAARAALPQAIQDETDRLLSPAVAKEQILARVRRYGWPMIGSAVGSVIGGPVGAAVGALGGAGMRPAARAWMNMARHPSVALPLSRGMESAAVGMTRAAPAATSLGITLASPSARVETKPVPTPRELAQADPTIGEAYQRNGSQGAAAAFYNEAQTRPEQVLGWLNTTEP